MAGRDDDLTKKLVRRLRPKAEIGLATLTGETGDDTGGPGGPSMAGARRGGQFTLKAEGKGKGGRKPAVTAVSLRTKPLPEAIEIAKTEQHLIPKKEGGFVGAPYSARTKADLDMIRAKFDADVAAGATGADWYPRAQAWIKEVAGSDPARQSELARNLALFSAQADPKGNLGFSVAARNAAIMGEPLEKVRTGAQARTYNEASGYRPAAESKEQLADWRKGKVSLPYEELLGSSSDIKLGPKTGIYGGHMDPTVSSPTTGTNDIWHARALGYTTPEGAPWKSKLTPQQHAVMDAETVLAVDRANQANLAGRSDWTPGEIQASPWVAGKGRGLEKSRGMTAEQGLAEASKTYPDYAPSFTASGTHEMTPGKTTEHLPNIAKGAEPIRERYASEPSSWWQGEGGRDILYGAQGAYVAPTKEMTGIFEGGFNPGQSAQPLVSFSGPSGRRVVDPASQQMMTGTEAFRAMMDAQDAGAWSMTIPGQRMGHSNAYELNLPVGMQGREGLAQVMGAAKGQGMELAHLGGRRAMATDFGAEPGLSTQGKRDMTKAMDVFGVGVNPVRREGEAVFYDWSKPGSDTVTKEMLSRLNPAQEAAFSSPEVQQRVLGRREQDIAASQAGGGAVREDLQTARYILGTEGIEGLKAAIGKGLLPVAVLGALLPILADQREGS